jgi:SAM-dependent methyltransferase
LQYDQAVADVFGYRALQLGLAGLDTLHNNRMPHRWLAHSSGLALREAVTAQAGRSAMVTDFDALPFAENSLDLVTLPHALELCPDPHGTLSEVQRVLIPEGRVIISGLNPASLWGLRQRRTQVYRRLGLSGTYVPGSHEWIGYWRLRDWLRLLSFEVESVRFGCYRPSLENPVWLDRMAWLDRVGRRWWPIFGGVYFVVAVKRVRGMKLMSQAWKQAPKIGAAPAASAPVSVAGKAQPVSQNREKSV